MNDDATDLQLLAACQAGDAAAWATLVRRYQRLVYAVVRRAGLDEHTAHDVFQTVFTRLLEHLPRIRDGARVQAWLVTTAKREVLALWRHSRRTVSLTPMQDEDGDAASIDLADDALIPEQALDELQQAERVRRALERLDARCRELLLLVFRADDDTLAYDEVARRLNMPVGSVGPTRARCLGKLRTLVR